MRFQSKSTYSGTEIAVRIMSRLPNGILGCLCAAICALPACAQYPGHIETSSPSNGPHLRATAVLEYTGTLDHITASRLVPIAIWDGVEYEPGALYLADPEPLAVVSGTQYELETDGRSRGFFNVSDAEQLAGLWIGAGRFQAPQVVARLAPSKNMPHVVRDYDPDKPHFAHVPSDDTSQNGTGSTVQTDSNQPTLHQRPAGSSGTDSGSGTSSTGSNQQVSAQSSEDSGGPTLHRHGSAAQASANTMPIDPDRPRLSYANPDATKSQEPTVLFGLPSDMKQIAGISDSRKLDTESYAFIWSNPDDANKMQNALESIAEQALAPPPPPAPAPAHGARHKAQPVVSPAPPILEDEEFHAYGLTFGGGATLVLSGQAGTDPVKYVTVVAQPDFYGNPQVLLKQVTTSNDLDAVPRLRLIDSVDTTGSGGADLIFELRGQTFRQFAIYRIEGGQATQVFITQPMTITRGATE